MESNNFPKNISINENIDNDIINEEETFEYKYNQIKPKVKTISIKEVIQYSVFKKRKKLYNIPIKINEKKEEKKEKNIDENNIKRKFKKNNDDKLIKTNTNSKFNFLVRKISRDEYFYIINKKNKKSIQKEEKKNNSCIKSVEESNTSLCIKSISDKCIKSTRNQNNNDFYNYSPKYYHNPKKT